MTTLTLPFPSGRGARHAGVLQHVANFFDGIREGLALAARFDRLSGKSDADLARLGLRREDIPRAVFVGRGR